MAVWLKIIIYLLFGILFMTVLFSLGSKNWARGFRESLKFVLLYIIVILVVISAMVLSMIFLDKNHRLVSFGVVFVLMGLAFIVGGPYRERTLKIIAPPRLLEYREAFGIADQSVKGGGYVFIVMGLLFVFMTVFLPYQDPNILLEWTVLLVIYSAATLLIFKYLLSAIRMYRRFAMIGCVDRETLMTYWPPVVISLFGPQRTLDWEFFKKRLTYQVDFGVRKALLMMLPEQNFKRIIFLALLFIMIGLLFIPNSRPSHSPDPVTSALVLHKFSIAAIWIVALLMSFAADRIGRKFMAALQARVRELDSLESVGQIGPEKI